MAIFAHSPKWIKIDLALLLGVAEAASHMADLVLCVQ